MTSPVEGRGSTGSTSTQTITAIDATWTSPQTNTTGHAVEVLLDPVSGTLGVATDGSEARIATDAGQFKFRGNTLVFPQGQQLSGVQLGDSCTELITLDHMSGGTPSEGTLLYYSGGEWHALLAGANGQALTMVAGDPAWSNQVAIPDATTTTPGLVEIAVPASGAHPVALTTDQLDAASGVAKLDANKHVIEQPVDDPTEAQTNDTLGATSTIVNNLNRIRYQLSQLGTGAWNTLRAMVQLSPASQQTGTINVSGEIQGADLKAGGLTGATASSRYVGATASGAPTTGTFAKGDFVIDQTGTIWICTAAGAPGTWTVIVAPDVDTLAGLTDAAIVSPQDGDLLVYRASDGKWHNYAPGAAGTTRWEVVTDRGGNLLVDNSGAAVMALAANG